MCVMLMCHTPLVQLLPYDTHHNYDQKAVMPYGKLPMPMI